MDVGLRQECVLSLLLFKVYMNWIDRHSLSEECIMDRRSRIIHLLFGDDIVLLASSNRTKLDGW